VGIVRLCRLSEERGRRAYCIHSLITKDRKRGRKHRFPEHESRAFVQWKKFIFV
jgi:hypothetical protein